MTASKQFRGLLAGVATVAMIGTAIAQGTPPDPAVKSAPVGAGQQSTQQTPMGTTGTPGTSGTPSTSGATPPSSSTAAGTSGSGSMGSTPPSTDTSVASSGPRRVRADRN